MNKPVLNKEQRVMRMMRKVLGEVIKDVTPRPGYPHPLKPDTIEMVRECFALISARERELAEETGLEMNERPHYKDEALDTQVVPLDSIPRVRKKKPETDTE